MEPVTTVRGRAVPLNRADIDTDQILPSEWLKRVERTGFGQGLFSEWRDDPNFVLNRHEYKGATILVTGPNFGIGSSREHAVWALMDYGFAAVVSPCFADIFKTNCTKQGLLPVEVNPEFGWQLLGAVAANPGLEIRIDVYHRTIDVPAVELSNEFPLDALTLDRFRYGLDDIDLTLQQEDDIAAYEATRPAWLPRVDTY